MWEHIEPVKFIDLSLLSKPLSKRSSKGGVKYTGGFWRTLGECATHGIKPRPVRFHTRFQSLSKKSALNSTAAS